MSTTPQAGSEPSVAARAGGRRRFDLSNDPLFWTLQVAGWLGLALLAHFSLTVSFAQTAWPYLLHPFVQSLIGIGVSWPMRSVFRFAWNRSLVLRLGLVVGSVVLFSFIWNYLRLVTFIWMTGEQMDFETELSVWYFSGVLVFGCWAALYHGFRYYRLLQEEHETLLRIEDEKRTEQLRRVQAERLAQEAQLKMLRYQLNPHFLFNTMNAITSLVNSGRKALACEMIDSLSSILRNTLEGDPLRRVSLREELDLLRRYLDIEQARFGDRLQTEFRVDPEDLDYRVPGMLLQPLAENAIKHAVSPSEGAVRLTIGAHVDGAELELHVEDTGPGMRLPRDAARQAGGIGLRNVRERLESMYGERFDLRFESASDGGLRVVIRLPLVREPQGAGPMAVGHA